MVGISSSGADHDCAWSGDLFVMDKFRFVKNYANFILHSRQIMVLNNIINFILVMILWRISPPFSHLFLSLWWGSDIICADGPVRVFHWISCRANFFILGWQRPWSRKPLYEQEMTTHCLVHLYSAIKDKDKAGLENALLFCSLLQLCVCVSSSLKRTQYNRSKFPISFDWLWW